MKIDALLKKREALEAAIRQEQAATKRRVEVIRLIERFGALHWPDENIVAALTQYQEARHA